MNQKNHLIKESKANTEFFRDHPCFVFCFLVAPLLSIDKKGYVHSELSSSFSSTLLLLTEPL